MCTTSYSQLYIHVSDWHSPTNGVHCACRPPYSYALARQSRELGNCNWTSISPNTGLVCHKLKVAHILFRPTNSRRGIGWGPLKMCSAMPACAVKTCRRRMHIRTCMLNECFTECPNSQSVSRIACCNECEGLGIGLSASAMQQPLHVGLTHKHREANFDTHARTHTRR